MNPPEENIDVLQNLEFVVVRLWRRHPEMSDHVALRAYEATRERYRAEARGHSPKPCALTGLDREAYDELCAVCEFRRGGKPLPGDSGDPIPPIPVSQLLDCLRELCKSVERHTELGGRQGYLQFIDRFIP